jgi:5-methylcytosine-specific restriction endonuclease McrA
MPSLPSNRGDALAIGASHYFTGIPCKHGHIAPRRVVSNGSCAACRKNKPESAKRAVLRYRASDKGKATLKAYRDSEKYKTLRILYQNRRRARKIEAEGCHTVADMKRLRIKQGNRCAYCRVHLGRGSHLDHIVSLSKGGSNWPRNLQWLCLSCNSRKHARDPIEFARAAGMLI